jgi:hypothetical protein
MRVIDPLYRLLGSDPILKQQFLGLNTAMDGDKKNEKSAREQRKRLPERETTHMDPNPMVITSIIRQISLRLDASAPATTALRIEQNAASSGRDASALPGHGRAREPESPGQRSGKTWIALRGFGPGRQNFAQSRNSRGFGTVQGE